MLHWHARKVLVLVLYLKLSKLLIFHASDPAKKLNAKDTVATVDSYEFKISSKNGVGVLNTLIEFRPLTCKFE